MMSRSYLLIVVLPFIACRGVKGQTTDLLQQPIYLQQSQVTVSQALKLLEEEVGLLMAYPSSLIPEEEIARDLSWKGTPLKEGDIELVSQPTCPD